MKISCYRFSETSERHLVAVPPIWNLLGFLWIGSTDTNACYLVMTSDAGRGDKGTATPLSFSKGANGVRSVQLVPKNSLQQCIKSVGDFKLAYIVGIFVSRSTSFAGIF